MIFPFSVLKQIWFVLQQNLHQFELLQIFKIGQRVFELNKLQTRCKIKEEKF
jgi:hypothetical protein